MSGTRPSVLLLSSNRRRRYAEDILTALALPRGALIQFRYEANYVVASLQQKIADGSVVGQRCLIAFVADAESAPESPFVVPARFASVVTAVCIADMFVFKLQVDDYANLEQFPLTEKEIREKSKSFIDKLRELNGNHYFPATAKFPDLRLHEDHADDPQLWLGVARRLAQHQTFRGSYFVRIEKPVSGTGEAIEFDAAGRLSLSDRKSLRIRASFYSENYSESVKQLTCTTDGTYLKISSDDSYDVALRYDTVEFWLHPAVLNFDALTRVTIKLREEGETGLPPGSDSLTTRAGFPVVVRRSRSRLIIRVTATALGAFCVALPAILGVAFPLEWRVLSAVTGAGLLAFTTIVISRGEK